MDLSGRAHFGDYDPSSFGWVLPPAGLVHFEHSGVPFGLMNPHAVPLFTALLDELVPLIPSRRLVAGQCGCYNPRSITNGNTPSFHAYATAIDVNWGSNPMYVRNRPELEDSLPAATSALARRYGCEWGGNWSYPQDWMHIEIHVPPDVAAAVTKPAPPAPTKDGFDMASTADLTRIISSTPGPVDAATQAKLRAAIARGGSLYVQFADAPKNPSAVWRVDGAQLLWITAADWKAMLARYGGPPYVVVLTKSSAFYRLPVVAGTTDPRK